MFSLTRLTIRRAREERLALVAGSLTFTTVLATATAAMRAWPARSKKAAGAR